MRHRQRQGWPYWLVSLVLPMMFAGTGWACTFCLGGLRSRPTWGQQAVSASWVLYGSLANPRFDPGSEGGSTEFHVREVLRGEAGRIPPRQIVLPVYLPVIGNATPRDYIVLAHWRGQRWEVLGGFPASEAVVAYLKGVLQLPPRDTAARCAYFFRHLDHLEAAVATDALAELGRISDVELCQAASGGAFPVVRLRQLLRDPRLTAEGRGMLAYLLGLCGQVPSDTDLLRQLWQQWSAPPGTGTSHLLASESPPWGDSRVGSGILTGLILLDPSQGWRVASEVLSDPQRPFSQRWAVLETLRFFQAFRPPVLASGLPRPKQESAGLRRDHRADILRCYALLVRQGDLADQAVEDLRRWGWWDLTGDILRHFDAPTHRAPIVRRAMVRYLLSAPGPEAQDFLRELRRREPDLVRSVEELLQQYEPAGRALRR
jgi:hypothetical protein